MTATREWPVPPEASTIHFLGDLHVGAVSSVRTAKVIADLAHPLVPDPLAHFQVGDVTDAGTAGQDTTALALLAQITDAPVYVACGNHDIWQNVRTVSAWQTAYAGYLVGGSKNYVVDFTDVRVIVVGPDAMNYPSDQTSIPLTQATLDWLEARLSATSNDCWIVCHAPLKDTVVGSTAVVWSSAEAGFFVLGPNGTNDTEIRTLLGAHSNAKAWISGHTHSPISISGFAALTTCGTRSVAAINTSAIYYTGRTQEWNDPIISVYLTRTAAGAIGVRYRDHGAGSWVAPATTRVTTLTPS